MNASSEDRFAASLRGFGPLGTVAMFVILAANLIAAPVSAALVFAWASWSRTSLRELGFRRPTSWIGTVVVGVAIGIVFKLVMKAMVMPLFGADPINQTYHYLVGNAAAVPAILVTVIVSGGFCEETVYRGYTFERLGKIFGNGLAARILTVVLTTAVFALAHYPDQRLAGVEQASITGLAFGTIFAATGRIWTLMIAHAAFDVTAIAMIYWNLESSVAHLIFK